MLSKLIVARARTLLRLQLARAAPVLGGEAAPLAGDLRVEVLVEGVVVLARLRARMVEERLPVLVLELFPAGGDSFVDGVLRHP